MKEEDQETRKAQLPLSGPEPVLKHCTGKNNSYIKSNFLVETVFTGRKTITKILICLQAFGNLAGFRHQGSKKPQIACNVFF